MCQVGMNRYSGLHEELLGRPSANPPFRPPLCQHAELAKQPMPFYPSAIKPDQTLALRLRKPSRCPNPTKELSTVVSAASRVEASCLGDAHLPRATSPSSKYEKLCESRDFNIAFAKLQRFGRPSRRTAKMSMFRAKKLDLGCFVKARTIRDHTKRKVFEEHETER
ncbi:mitochondrial 40s ribosomal mrp2 [Trichoderma arundinaceum]|uniref:Mitochondrial 40s ribosomal mrp2 n=1 Tax=Trichoderma arundinaceum TaxID=490622 RepID=A0A395NIT5_TRIAR|nr:mitochondrial 40s ribosomal mrp2 [Trichoderma arundinaceum]